MGATGPDKARQGETSRLAWMLMSTEVEICRRQLCGAKNVSELCRSDSLYRSGTQAADVLFEATMDHGAVDVA